MAPYIRRATMLDQEGVVALLQALRGDEMEARGEGWAEAFPLLMNSPDHAILVVEDEGAVVGLASVYAVLSLPVGGAYAEVDLLLLQADYRRQGLGGRLVESAVAWARDRGCKELRVEARGPQSAVYFQRMGCQERAPNQFVWPL